MTNLLILQDYLKMHHIDAFIVLHDDMFAGEYLSPADERLAWATSFTGSAGLAIITQDKALLLTDSRYTLQAAQQCPHLDVVESNAQPFEQIKNWLQQNLPQGVPIAFDPWLFSQKRLENWQSHLKNTQFHLVPLKQNPIDVLWQDRPIIVPQKFWQHPLACAGVSTGDKIKNLGITEPTMITDVASVNWLLNIRGNDIPYTPYVQGFTLVMPQGDVTLFIDLAKVPQDLPPFIQCVALSDLANFNYPAILQADTSTVPAALWHYWQDKKMDVHSATDPCYMPRTIKNSVELAGAQQAHIYDAVAMIQFLHWFSQQKERTDLTECDVADKLQSFRAQQIGYYSDSFDTIAGSGPNGAIVHYRPEPTTCRTLQQNEMLLLDSGAQYNDTDFCGTTDITRVLWFGQGVPTAEAKKHYTMVLKAHIGAASLNFLTHKTTGAQIDTLARPALWAQGLDCPHRLGHGVSSFGSVHDVTVRLDSFGQESLPKGALFTIEPGIYLKDKVGVRLENIYQVVDGSCAHTSAFRPLTLVPFEVQLIDYSALEGFEIKWLEAYHKSVLETVSPFLDFETQQFLLSYLM